ncbi:MAG: 50S ribosomal protein L15 [Planctomycetota bacterium]
MNLTQLKQGMARSRKNVKRRGRGDASGHGGTSGRGNKGQKARAGYTRRLYFEGGQMPLVRKTPKRGFKNVRFAKRVAIINIDNLNIFDNNEIVTIESLQKSRLIRGEFDAIKVLGSGQLEKEGLTVHAHRFSESARKKIEDKKGKVVLCKD